MAITTLERTQIEKVFIAFLNAAPSITYLDQLVGYAGRADVLAKDLSKTDSFLSIYPVALTNDEFAGQFVANFIGSTASDAAKAYVKDEVVKSLNAGVSRGDTLFNVVVALQSVPDGDPTFGTTKKAFENKVAVADYYAVTKLGTATDLATLHNVIAGVTASSDVSSSTALDTILSGTVTGQTFTLTAGSDNFTGTAGNDTFEAGVANGAGGLVDTLQGIDQLSGGAGIDTLNATLNSAGLVAPSLSGIENVNVRVTTATAGLDLVGAAGVTAVTVAKSTAAANVQNTGAAALGVANQNTAVTFGGSTATALSLNLDTVGTAATDIAIDIGTTKANAATSFAITAKDAHVTFTEALAGAATTSASVAATGANEITFAAADLASLKTLTVTGAGSADFTGGALSALSALTTLTAGDGGVKVTGTSAAATALTATTGAGADTLVFNAANVKSITTGAGNDAVTLNTGALAATATVALGEGNDIVTLSGAAPVAGAAIDGGAGTDTFATTNAFYNTVSTYTAPQRALISNFEVLSITDTLANGATVDVSSLTGVGSFTAAAGVIAGGNATVSKLGAASTVTIAGNNTGVAAVTAVSEVQNVAVTGAATAQVSFLGTAVAGSANADTASVTVGRIVADKVALITAWNVINPTLEILDLAAGAGTSIDITYRNTEGNVAELAASASAGINFALATQTTLGVAAAAAVAAGSLTANLATDTSADALTLVLNNNYVDNNDTAADARAVSNKFVVADIESLTVNSTGTIAPAIVTKVDGYKADVLTNTLDLTGSNKLTSITVTGDQKLTLATTAAQTKLATIDASANRRRRDD